MARSRNRRRLGFEALEERTVLAGDVTAVIVGDVLQITGDGDGNQIVVKQTESGYVVTPVEGSDTMVTSEGPFSGVTGGIYIDLEGGDDYVELRSDISDALAGDITIDMGAGGDTVIVQGTDPVDRLDLAGSLDIDTGADDDQVFVLFLTVGGSLNVTTGDGFDVVSGTIGEVQGDLDVRVGEGVQNVVDFESFDVHGDVIAVGGAGQDLFFFVALNQSLPAGEGGAFLVATGAGADTLILQNIVVNGGAVITMGGGNDQLFVDYSQLNGGTFIATGDGDDMVGITGGELNGVTTILLQGGDDYLTIGDDDLLDGDTDLNGLVIISGGAGYDSVDISMADKLDAFFMLFGIESLSL
jgi:hypothetical protein